MQAVKFQSQLISRSEIKELIKDYHENHPIIRNKQNEDETVAISLLVVQPLNDLPKILIKKSIIGDGTYVKSAISIEISPLQCYIVEYLF